ncbi:MAG: hypothetical protein H6707_14090 [Deltaproteobacteria bacterium]|nr:hypothetical protein [Deltaproteobacteria bacterium]
MAIDSIVRAVTQALHQRLGTLDPQLIERVTHEVLGALEDPAERSAASPSAPLRVHDDGTITTGLGARIAHPAGSLPTCASCVETARREITERAIVTATGINKRGVLASLTTSIAEAGGNIQDVSQTIISDFFTLILVVALDSLTISLADLKDKLKLAAERQGIRVVVMHEDVLRSLQRV